MQAKPISAVIEGINITDLFSFRYGTRVMEQQFFELKFRQPLFGSTFSFGLDNPKNYNNEAITLYLSAEQCIVLPVIFPNLRSP